MLGPFAPQLFGDHGPSLAMLGNRLNEVEIFLGCPGGPECGGVEVVDPVFPALLRSSEKPLIRNNKKLFGDLVPLILGAF